MIAEKGGEAVAFEGWLLKINGRLFPEKYIAHGSYSSTPNQQQDEDSYTDSLGELVRNVLPHTRSKIEWTTPMIHLAGKQEMQTFFPGGSGRIKANVEYWNDEDNAYTTGVFYLPDVKFDYYDVDPETKDIRYKPIRIGLIEY